LRHQFSSAMDNILYYPMLSKVPRIPATSVPCTDDVQAAERNGMEQNE